MNIERLEAIDEVLSLAEDLVKGAGSDLVTRARGMLRNEIGCVHHEIKSIQHDTKEELRKWLSEMNYKGLAEKL